MQILKGALIAATIISTIAVTACRREEYHQPMKLGADLPVAQQVAR